jgi:hypothetical protein
LPITEPSLATFITVPPNWFVTQTDVPSDATPVGPLPTVNDEVESTGAVVLIVPVEVFVIDAPSAVATGIVLVVMPLDVVAV